VLEELKVIQVTLDLKEILVIQVLKELKVQ